MSARGVFMVIVGVVIVTQVLGGNALKRLKVT